MQILGLGRVQRFQVEVGQRVVVNPGVTTRLVLNSATEVDDVGVAELT